MSKLRKSGENDNKKRLYFLESKLLIENKLQDCHQKSAGGPDLGRHKNGHGGGRQRPFCGGTGFGTNRAILHLIR
jgi:hypothetical protein